LSELNYDGDYDFVYHATGELWERGKKDKKERFLPAPLKQQVLRWFREKYELYYHIFPLQITASDKTGYRYSWEIYNHTPEWIANDEELLGSLTYKEAENTCINKLIEIAKQQENGI
jgi:hypothetical protein